MPSAASTPVGRPAPAPRSNHEPARIRSAAPPIASNAATATIRHDPNNAASSGISTSQIAANEFMPPELAATIVTMMVSANAERPWAALWRPVRERKQAVEIGTIIQASATNSSALGTPRNARNIGNTPSAIKLPNRRGAMKARWRSAVTASSRADGCTSASRKSQIGVDRLTMLSYVDGGAYPPFTGSCQRPFKRTLRKLRWRHRNIETVAEKQFWLTDFSDMVNTGLRTRPDGES